MFALDVATLRSPDITFWSAWENETLVGCAALKALSDEHAEVKSMRTPKALRRRGAARALIVQVIDEARRRDLRRLSLETGSNPAFGPAQALYDSVGFVRCAPFAGYRENGHSVFSDAGH
ncbi:MAG: GNAT family N-acetyltransferase [Burkholderiaceae bacterium]